MAKMSLMVKTISWGNVFNEQGICLRVYEGKREGMKRMESN